MARYFIDSEFIEDGITIDPISVGIVCDDNREYYAINLDCDFSKANHWVKNNVLNQLPPKTDLAWKHKYEIADEVAKFLGCSSEVTYYVRNNIWGWWDKLPLYFGLLQPKITYKLGDLIPQPEFWGYYADYDWVVFCQLFGTMMDLPKGFPMYCRDLKQWYDQLGEPRLPVQEGSEHNALEDAKYNKAVYDYLKLCDNRLKVIGREVL